MVPRGPIWKDSMQIRAAFQRQDWATLLLCVKACLQKRFNSNTHYGFLDVILLISFSFVCLPKAFIDLRGEALSACRGGWEGGRAAGTLHIQNQALPLIS